MASDGTQYVCCVNVNVFGVCDIPGSAGEHARDLNTVDTASAALLNPRSRTTRTGPMPVSSGGAAAVGGSVMLSAVVASLVAVGISSARLTNEPDSPLGLYALTAHAPCFCCIQAIPFFSIVSELLISRVCVGENIWEAWVRF